MSERTVYVLSDDTPSPAGPAVGDASGGVPSSGATASGASPFLAAASGTAFSAESSPKLTAPPDAAPPQPYDLSDDDPTRPRERFAFGAGARRIEPLADFSRVRVTPQSVTRVLTWIVVAALALAALQGGLVLRIWMWPASHDTLRFASDIGNAWKWGNNVEGYAHDEADRLNEPNEVLTWRQFWRGYVVAYDRVDAEADDSPDPNVGKQYSLDYPPFRLLAMSLWVWHTHAYHPDLDNWQDNICGPLLALNTVCELIACVAAFLLVWLWTRRSGQTAAPSRGWLTRSLLGSRQGPLPTPDADRWWPCNGWVSATVSLATLFVVVACASARGGLLDPPLLAGMAVLILIAIASIRGMSTPNRAWFAGLFAALLLWFNPTVLLESHTWPQWDVWVIPAFLLGALLISLNRGFTAGVVILIGAFMKGQTLLVFPLLALWPLFAGRWDVALRYVVGFAFAGAALTWWWVVPDNAAWMWIVSVCFSAAVVLGASGLRGQLMRDTASRAKFLGGRVKSRFRRQFRAGKFAGVMNAADSEAETGTEFSVRGPEQSAYRQADARSAAENSVAGGAMGADSALEVPISPPPLRRQTAFRPIPILAAWIAAAVAIGFALFLLVTDMGHGGVPRLTAYAFVAIIVLPPWVMPRRWNGVWLAAVFAGAVFQAGVSFGGSFAWLRIGLAYGEHHFLDMAIGPTHNFANVLRNRFGWSLDQDPDNLFTMPVPWSDTPVTFYVKPLLCTVYGLCLALSAIGAALHARNRDPRVLMALVAPWVCAFAILCQMHERYAMYGCALASLGIAAGAGEALLYFVLAFAATQPMLDAALSRHAGANPQLLQFLQQTDPSLGWLFLILAAVYLWIAIAPRRRSEPFAGS